MKKLGIVLLVVFGAALGLALLAAAQVDRFRPILIRRMETALGQPVRLERMTLGWRGGIALDLQGFAAGRGAGSAEGPAVRVRRASAVLRLGPLLRREFEIGSVALTGLRAHLIRKADGLVEVEGLSSLSKPAAGGGARAGLLPFWVVRRFRVEDSQITLTDFSLQPALEVTVQDLGLLARLDLPADGVDLARFSGRVGPGSFSGSAKIRGIRTQPEGTMELQWKGLELDSILRPSPPGQPGVHGRLFGSLELEFRGKDGPAILRSLRGEGRIRLEEGRISDLNVLRAVFERLTILPGLAETLMARLPPSYAEKLQVNQTLFEPVDLQARFEGGSCVVDEVSVATDSFELTGGKLSIGPDGRIRLPARIGVEPDLTEAFVRSVEELRFLTDNHGRLVLPVLLEGRLPQVFVLPDVPAVASRLMGSKAQDFVGTLLENILEK